MISISDKDNGLQKLLRQALLGIVTVAVGYPAEHDEPHDEVSNAYLAAVHEFGTDDIPERSFLRRTFDEKQGWAEESAKLAGKVVDGSLDLETAAGRLGARAVADIRRTVTGQDIPPPLEPETVRRKGSSKPLVDTGQLIGALAYVVRR